MGPDIRPVLKPHEHRSLQCSDHRHGWQKLACSRSGACHESTCTPGRHAKATIELLLDAPRRRATPTAASRARNVVATATVAGKSEISSLGASALGPRGASRFAEAESPEVCHLWRAVSTPR